MPGREHPLLIEADEPGVYRGQCTEFCGLSHAYMRMRVVAARPRPTTTPGRRTSWRAPRCPPASWPQAGHGAVPHHLLAAATSSSGPGGNEEFREEDGIEGAALVAGAAPNLTHFASRGAFAGAIFDLWVDEDGSGEIEADEIGGRACSTSPTSRPGCATRRPRSRWPPASRAACPTSISPMQQIDALVAYLKTLE